jgi:rRNA-processing protein FCF1
MGTRGFLLVDANVLIDYQAADLAILSLVSRHVGPVHIVSTVLTEVEGLDESDCERLGFRVVEPSIEQANAAAPPNGRLSLADRLCCVICQDNSWTCASNDKALRRACETAGVAVLWSLELLLELVKFGHLPADDASQAAERMQRANPIFFDTSILAAFCKKLDYLKA